MHSVSDVRFLKDLNIEVVTGTSVHIIVQDFNPIDYCFYMLWIGQFLPWDQIVGTEPVSLVIGVDGTVYPLIDRAGNIVVAGRLRGAHAENCVIVPHKYRLQFGTNGMPTAVSHFVVYEGLCAMRYNGLAPTID